MKQITITVPDNCELKVDGNKYTVVEKTKKLTYEDVTKALFEGKVFFYINEDGNINCADGTYIMYDELISCTSKKQTEKLLAIHKLMNVAKYLNGGWQPDWKDESEDKYSYSIQVCDGELLIRPTGNIFMEIYFKSEEVAKQAIEILGEENIRLALCTDY